MFSSRAHSSAAAAAAVSCFSGSSSSGVIASSASRRPHRREIAANAGSRSEGDKRNVAVDDNTADDRKRKLGIATAATAAAAAATSLLATPSPAAAWEHPHHGWIQGGRPRRHLRAMGDFDRERLLKDERRREQSLRELRAAKANNINKKEQAPLPPPSNALDAVADDAAAAVEGAAAAASRAAARVRGWVREHVAVASGDAASSAAAGGGGDDDLYFSARASRPLVRPPTSSSSAMPRYRPGAISSSGSVGISSDAVFAIGSGLAMFLGVAAVAAVVKRVTTGSFWWGPRGKRGRWVRDRSLGGKLVFVEDFVPEVEGSGEQRRRRRVSPNADLFLDEEGEGGGGSSSDTGAERGARSVSSTSSSSSSSSKQQLPSWWPPPPSSSSSSSSSTSARTRFERDAAAAASRDDPTVVAATATLRFLEDSKVSGRDYDVASLVAIRRALAGSGVSLKPRTSSVRDAMFRAAAAAAAEEASGGSGTSALLSPLLGGIAPDEFVAGCATDLGVPTADAVNMSLAAVASRARALLVDALASKRARDEPEALLLVARLASLLCRLPLPKGGPQAPMVAEAISQRATLDERRALFEETVAVLGGRAAVVAGGSGSGTERDAAVVAAELLGFDPELVVPK